MSISLRHIPVHPLMKGYIEKLWVFESSGRVPDVDMKLVVPNGMIKLVIPFCNTLSGQREGLQKTSKTNEMTLIGVADVPFVVEAGEDAPSGTIGVEFNPAGAYRFFKLHQSELKNQIACVEDVLGSMVRAVQQQISETATIDGKVKVLQSFLMRLFRQSEPDNVFDYCVKRIQETRGSIAISELEKATGYSSRWLNLKFDQKIGVSPKNLCAISRFLFVYEGLANDPQSMLKNKAYYNLYYDQAHFIKEFKRFTGMPPAKFEHRSNDFGKIFYRK